MNDSTNKFSQTLQNLKSAVELGVVTLTTKAPEAAKAVKAMIDEYGGVGNFIQAITKDFQESDVAGKAKVWIEDGKKFVLSQEQVQKLLGDERIQKISAELKTTPDKLATLLGEALPPILEKVEFARKKLEEASKAVPQDSLVANVLNKVTNFLGNSKT
ncbi:MAG: hypothetical protein H7301_12530 [Cryobacterium sp.]|nr:hypothetical protein [Oligoflexia bacterium]